MNDLQKMLLSAARGLMFSMGHGFHILLYEPELNEWSKTVQNEIRALASEPNKVAKNMSKGTGLNDLPKPDEFAFICERYSAWMEVRERILNSKEANLLQQREAEGTNWLYLWSHMFKDMEAFYNWLLAVHQEVGKKPEKLAEWALRGSIAEMPPVFTEPYIRLPW